MSPQKQPPVRAVKIRDRALSLCERPFPVPGTEEVLIRVAAAGVNRADLLQRLGRYPPPPGVTDIPGLEVSGWIMDEQGREEPVCALVPGGGYATHVCAPRALCLPVPSGLSMKEAAGLPEAAFTAWMALFVRGGLVPGESVLIHGGASGIGTLAVQIARSFGARVVTTAGGAGKCATVRALGAARVVDYKASDPAQADFVAACREETEGKGVALVVDLAGGDWLARNLDALAPGGRHISLAWMRGARAELPLSVLLRKGLTLSGFTLRDRPVAEKAAIARALLTDLWPLIESGSVRPVLQGVYSFSDAQRAHDSLERGEGVGKRILVPDE
ncbi:MAG TPA: NAD(P)H-quinone oxidoreductase [Alphaproteobacteria bacterium]|nr:NAD(P)H-quinone oxidoreductase [Alphaproteobacteria bacterium]